MRLKLIIPTAVRLYNEHGHVISERPVVVFSEPGGAVKLSAVWRAGEVRSGTCIAAIEQKTEGEWMYANIPALPAFANNMETIVFVNATECYEE